jgi:hypothetical protein
MFHATWVYSGSMNIGRIASAFMIIALMLGNGLQASQMSGCMEDVPAMTTVNASQVDAERQCDHTGQAPAHVVTICHGICVAPIISVQVVQFSMPGVAFVAPLGAMEWRDTTSSPEPHPPKPITHI